MKRNAFSGKEKGKRLRPRPEKCRPPSFRETHFPAEPLEEPGCFFRPQAAQCPQSAQSHPQPGFPRFLRTNEAATTPTTTSAQKRTRTISIGCINPPLRHFSFAEKRYARAPQPRAAHFLSALFLRRMTAVTTAAAASQINSVHHQLPMVYTAAEMI